MPQEIDRKIADLQAGANEEFIRVRNERENTMNRRKRKLPGSLGSNARPSYCSATPRRAASWRASCGRRSGST